MFDVHQTTAAAYSVAVSGDTFVYDAVNDACLELVGLTPAFITGLDPKACFKSSIAEEILQRYRACRDTRQAISYVSEARLLKSNRRWRTTLFPVIGEDGFVRAIIGICVDASEETRADQLIETDNERLAFAMGAIDGGFWVYEMATGEFETSASLTRYIAGPDHQPLNLAEYASHVHAEDLKSPDLLSPSCDRPTSEYRVITFDGRTRWLQSRRRVVRDKTGAVVRVIGLVMDVTDQKKALNALETEASTDSLTALKNRRAFERATREALAEAAKNGGHVGLVLVDLDGFKPINDRYGHRAGDEVLRKVARRLARSVGETSMLARLGGDEFAILLRDASMERIDALAARIIGSFEKPIRFEDHAIDLGVSVGVALSDRNEPSIGALMESADRDLYAAKKENRRLTA